MKFEAIRRRVERHEQLVEGRALQTGTRLSALKTTWRESWTPARIVLAGLAAGFLVGRSDPNKALKRLAGGGRWLQLVGTLSGLFASLQASVASASAGEAVDHADEAANQASDAAVAAQAVAGDAAPAADDSFDADADAEQRPRTDRRRPDPTWTTPPAPAEAATDVSER
ncbi:MAG: protein sip-5 [Luteimonas sp.]|nr:protein sip-5 [Luteimonas sp.]